MPVQVDTPISTGNKSDWTRYGAAASKVAAVATNDGNTSVVYAASGGALFKDHYIFPALTGVVDPVNSASLSMVGREYLPGVGGQSLYLIWNELTVGNNRAGLIGSLPKSSYKTATYAAAGAELGLSVVTGQHGMRFSAAGGPSQKAEIWITHLYRTVNFDYTAGSADAFAHLLGTLAGIGIGAGLLLREMPALARHIFARGRVLLRPDEYEPAWRAWKARKRTVVV